MTMLVPIAVLTAILAYHAFRARGGARDCPTGAAWAGRLGLACVGVVVLYAVVAASGRSCLALWHFRYNAVAIGFASVAIGLALSIVLARLSRAPRTVIGLALLGAGMYLAIVNVAVVRASAMATARGPASLVDPTAAEAARHPGKRAGRRGETAVAEPPSLPVVRASHPGHQIIPHDVETALRFDGERFDTDELHDLQASTSRLTVHTAGRYLAMANVAFERGQGGIRRAAIRLNRDEVLASREMAPHAEGHTNLFVDGVAPLAVGDYVELHVTQTSGGALTALEGSAYSPKLMLLRLDGGDGDAPSRSTLDEAATLGRGTDGPAVVAYHDAAQSLGAGLQTSLAFAGEWLDTDDLHNPRGNGSRLTCRVSGIYLVVGRATFAPHPVGHRALSIVLNRSVVIGWADACDEGDAPTRLSVASVFRLDAGTQVELRAVQTSGGPLDILGGGDGPRFAMVRVG